MTNYKKIWLYSITALLFLAVLFSGCVEQREDEIKEYSDEKLQLKINSLIEDNKKLNDRISTIENKPETILDNSNNAKIDKIEKTISMYGLVTSDKILIPEHVPFKVEFVGAKSQGSWTYVFKDNGFFDFYGIGGSDKDAATYTLDINNNTIFINSEKYDYYGIRLIDGYGYTISKTGSIVYSYKSTITPPRYNSVTQKYEIN